MATVPWNRPPRTRSPFWNWQMPVDIPVARGCELPLVQPSLLAPETHGDTGLGYAKLPAPRARPIRQHASRFSHREDFERRRGKSLSGNRSADERRVWQSGRSRALWRRSRRSSLWAALSVMKAIRPPWRSSTPMWTLMPPTLSIMLGFPPPCAAGCDISMYFDSGRCETIAENRLTDHEICRRRHALLHGIPR